MLVKATCPGSVVSAKLLMRHFEVMEVVRVDANTGADISSITPEFFLMLYCKVPAYDGTTV